MMKKRRSIAELIDGILDKKDAERGADGESSGLNEADSGHLARLGEAFLARLNIPEGMDEREAAERIIAMWEEADAPRASGEGFAEELDASENEAPVYEERGETRSAKLPSPIRGGLFEAPKADYESMSAEQFRRLKKQLERASMDGRKIRL